MPILLFGLMLTLKYKNGAVCNSYLLWASAQPSQERCTTEKLRAHSYSVLPENHVQARTYKYSL